MGTGLIGTIAALVLGLLIGSANSSYGNKDSQVQQITANVVLLDRTLSQYGPEADTSRNLLRSAVAAMADQIWNGSRAGSSSARPFEETAAAVTFYDAILKLSPGNDAQRSLRARAIDIANDVGKARLLLFAGTEGGIPMPFLVVLVCWLAIIFASFSLFADNNAATITALSIFALSASAAIFLILELNEPFTGFMMISSDPLRQALGSIGS